MGYSPWGRKESHMTEETYHTGIYKMGAVILAYVAGKRDVKVCCQW